MSGAPVERWLNSFWPLVRGRLPPPPASVLEIGCGSAGGFVPALLESRYDAVGIDRNAPGEGAYHQVDFEQYEPSHAVDAIVACRSLHHVADLGDVIGRAAAALRPGGSIVVVEWAWERFDEQTARWCFARLDADPEESGWLHRRRDKWAASGERWDTYFGDWTTEAGLHRGDRILAELDGRFERTLCDYGPYFFGDRSGITEQHEQAAIASGEIRATGIRYAGSLAG